MEQVKSSSSAKDDFKAPRIRSVAYPSFDLEHSTALTETIHKLFGNSVFIPREKIVEKTGISDGHIQMQLSTCVQYGLLELRSKEGYKVTSDFIKIYKPKVGEDVRALKISLFKTPDLYKKIIAEHNNENFTQDSLATLLYRDYKVSEAASTHAAKIFISNARYLKLLSEDNTFSVDDIQQVEEVEVLDEKPKVDSKQEDIDVQYLPPMRQEDKKGKSFNHPPIPVFVDESGSVAEVYLPHGFNKKHIEKVIMVLQAQIA